MFGFEGATYKHSFKAQWLSWLERRPVTAKVVGSSPIWVVSFTELLDGFSQIEYHFVVSGLKGERATVLQTEVRGLSRRGFFFML